MARASLTSPAMNGARYLLFECPGCEESLSHGVQVEGPGPHWDWNGDVDRPTLTPSILVRFDYGEDRAQRVCHSFIRDGQIQFLSDCTHALAGKTVDLPEVV